MKHLLNICNINGAEVEPVDVVIGGSPCQDLSVAGKRAGLDGERSGLFMEQIRVIKEMRSATQRANQHVRPRYMVWENVPGAFSSNKGEDFRIVVEETAKIADENAVIPRPPHGKWSNSGAVVGDGWSIAWRVFDAQFWGVPQRRRRIALVADFGGQSAPEILFERTGVSGDIAESGTKGEGVAGDVEGGVGEAIAVQLCGDRGNPSVSVSDIAFCIPSNPMSDRGQAVFAEPVTYPGVGITSKQNASKGTPGVCHTLNQDERNYVVSDRPAVFSFDSLSSNSMKSSNPHSGCRQVEIAKCIDTTNPDPSKNQGGMAVVHDARGNGDGSIAPTMTGDHQNRVTDYTGIVSYTATQFANYQEGVETLRANGGDLGGGSESLIANQSVRRLTPLECERLQGFPDNWTNIPPQTEVTADDLSFWRTVWDEWDDMNGKKRHSDKQIIKWLRSEPADNARYKALGNSIALPPWRFVLSRIHKQGARTMASLFDGIGGFPKIWQELGGQTLWCSEIEPFPIAVTMYHFKEAQNGK